MLTGFVERALAVARQYPDSPEAIDALEFALRWTSGALSGRLGDLGKEAVAIARQGYLTSASLDRLVPWLPHHYSAASRALLEAAIEKSPERAVRGRAAYWLAGALADEAEAAILLRQAPAMARYADADGGREHVQRLRTIDAETTSRRAEQLFETVQRRFEHLE